MKERGLPVDASAGNQWLPGQSVKPIRKPNYWKLGFGVVSLMLVLSVSLLVNFIKINTGLSSQLANSSVVFPVTSQQGVLREISVEIDPYRLDDEGGQMVATFKINNLNKESSLSKVTYWTDKNGPCKAKTEKFSEFIRVPASEIGDYVFFRFADDENRTSEIYAFSHNPIFQCGKLAE